MSTFVTANETTTFVHGDDPWWSWMVDGWAISSHETCATWRRVNCDHPKSSQEVNFTGVDFVWPNGCSHESSKNTLHHSTSISFKGTSRSPISGAKNNRRTVVRNPSLWIPIGPEWSTPVAATVPIATALGLSDTHDFWSAPLWFWCLSQ